MSKSRQPRSKPRTDKFKTDQERLWASEFGNEYIGRNQHDRAIASNIMMFGDILRRTPDVKSIVELGCNIGLNLRALHAIDRTFDLCGYEINRKAAAEIRGLKIANIVERTVTAKLPARKKYDLAFTKGLLIHVHPDQLPAVYDNLYSLSKRYILVSEYYNPTPVMVRYRGHDNQLFKRDFAGDLIDRYKLKLVDYGFMYRRDNYFPQSDNTWFLLSK